ncbi:hypothetical protein ACFL3U_04640 [Pseudomonadota bacterium]
MKKLIQTSLLSLALASAAFNVNASIENDATSQPKLSYACKAMLERGSSMFCGDAVNTDVYAKADISELAYVSSTSSYACETMAAQGSEMFCQAGKAVMSSQISNH